MNLRCLFRLAGLRVARRCLLPAVAVVFWLLMGAPSQAQKNPTLSLNGEWRFQLARDAKAVDALTGFYAPEFDAKNFSTLRVPSNWAMEGFEPPHYKPFKEFAAEGFYLRRFQVPAEFAQKRVVLHFDGVWSSAEVWLNGEPLGRHDSGFTEFSYDVSSRLKPGAENLLAVRVRQVQHDYLFDTNDDWSLGGIYRDVTLVTMPKERWLDRVDYTTTFDSEYRDADLAVRVMVQDTHRRKVEGNLPDASGGAYHLKFDLTDAAGQMVASRVVEVSAHNGTGRETRVSFHVAEPKSWTAETPNLYTLAVSVIEKGEATETVTRQVGFRQISTAGGIFRINGQAVKLRGVDRHDEHPDTGRATTPENWLQDIRLMKAANINFIRSSHYPPTSGFLDLCDKLGMYVEDEVPMGFGGDHAYDPSFAATVMQRSYETVERDVNHPSIILWSIGNEDPLTSLHMASVRTVKGLDATRPVLMPWRSEEWLPAEIDILAPHYFDATHYDLLAAHSTRPIITTEYTHAYGTDGFGGLEDTWRALTRHAAGAGGAIWMWADQGLNIARQNTAESRKNPLLLVDDGIDGIVGAYREPQRDYWETKAVYAQVFPTVSQLKYVPGQAAIRVPFQNEFDFTDLSAVRIDWRLMEDAKELDHGSVTPVGKAHAVAWIDVPLTAAWTEAEGRTRYLQFTILRADGSELTRASVELLAPLAETVDKKPAGAVISVEEGALTLVHVGNLSYSFDAKTGLLTAAARGQKTLYSGMQFTLWRPLTTIETSLEKRESELAAIPDLSQCKAAARQWTVTNRGDRAEIHAVIECVLDAANSWQADVQYRIDASGALTVHYSIVPHVAVKWVAQVGVAMDLAADANSIQWLGLGPFECYPNEKAACILGVWGGKPGDAAVVGNRMTRTIHAGFADGQTLRVEGASYLRSSTESARHMELLAAELGRTSKGRRPEWPEQQLNVVAGRPLVGEVQLIPAP